jgi:hypothetical protein
MVLDPMRKLLFGSLDGFSIGAECFHRAPFRVAAADLNGPICFGAESSATRQRGVSPSRVIGCNHRPRFGPSVARCVSNESLNLYAVKCWPSPSRGRLWLLVQGEIISAGFGTRGI